MKKLTIIAYLGAEYRLDSLLESLKNQTEKAFEKISEIQMIVTDSVGGMISQQKLEQQLPEHVTLTYLDCEGKNIAECYNFAMTYVQGEYVAFVDIDSRYSPKAMELLCEVLEDSSIRPEEKQCVCIRPVYVRPEGIENVYLVYPGTNGIRDVSVSTSNVNLCLYSYFINRSLLEKLHFDEQFPVESRALFCIELLELTQKFYCKNGPLIRFYHALEDAKGLFLAQHHKEWYTKTIRECYLPFVQKRYKTGTLTAATEAAILYLLYCRFSCNMGASDNEVLTDEEVEELYQEVYVVASYLSYETLLLQYKVKNQKMASWLLWQMIEQKIKLVGSTYKVSVVDGTAFLRVTDQAGHHTRYALFHFSQCKATVYAIDYEDGQLRVDLGLPLLPKIIMEQFHPQIIVSGGNVYCTQIYNDCLCFGRIVGKPTIYRAWIPIKKDKDYQQFHFSLQIQGELCGLSCVFAKRPAARLTASCSENYWLFAGNHVLQYQPAKQKFVIETCTKMELLAIEANFCRAIKLDRTLSKKEKKELIKIRRDYWERKLAGHSQKPIWITYDKLYKAGDNGEYLFHYVRKHCPEVDIYYLITENSADYERLKEDDHVLIHGSWESKLIVLQAQLILATHTNTMSGCGFTSEGEKRYLKNLYQAQVVCIQHGLTVQDIAIWQNILCDNTKLYCCASENEVKNIRQPEYGYTDKEIRLTGLARYDGLVNHDKRQILITPTWRRNVVNAGSSGNVRAKNEFFRETEYYKIYNSLINDPRLIACAKKNGYRIMYLIHPTLSSQIDDFDKNEYVDIVAAAGDMSYEKVLTESSLMVTDYSGVQFDFAYMRKPVLYYHPETLPPHYTQSSAFQYDVNGFGPIITGHDALVEEICAYMERNCQMDDFYKQRADQFFAFQDCHNCERIAKAVMEFAEQQMEDKNEILPVADPYDFIQIQNTNILAELLHKSGKSAPLVSRAKRFVKKIIGGSKER